MNLKPQDILFLLKLVSVGKEHWTFNKIAVDLGMSPSEIHAASKRALAARLAIKEGNNILPNIRNLEEFLLHGLQYVFIPERGPLNRGMPTTYAAAPLDAHFVGVNEPPQVWPDLEGEIRGESFSPLYKSAPFAAKSDAKLYQLLALVDAIRGGSSRERNIAKNELKALLSAATDGKEKLLMSDQDRLVIGGEIVILRTALQALAQRHHIRRLVLFGSAARGELKADSDIDLMVEFESDEVPSLGGMVEIQEAFSALFDGRRVDIATPSILANPYRRQAIEKNMEELYAA